MFLVTCVSPVLSTKAGAYCLRDSALVNMEIVFLVFFGFLGYHHDYTPDVRIYRQDRLRTKYMTDKKMAYSPQGLFAAYARGPMGLLNAASAAIFVALTGFVYLYVCLKSWAGAFGIGAVIQYVAFVKLLAGSVSSILSTAGCAQTHRF